jgi:hypothetical protein
VIGNESLKDNEDVLQLIEKIEKTFNGKIVE